MRADATCYRHPDRRASVSCQRCNRPICTECMIEAPVGFHCPEDAKAGQQKVITSHNLFRSAGRPIVTLTLMAVNLAVYVIGFGIEGGSERLRIDGGLLALGQKASGELIGVDAGEWYRIVTAGFLHASLLHLGFNMYLLYLLGQQLEPAMGRIRFGVTYFFSLLCGSLAVLLIDPLALTVGASGAVFGLMGALAVLHYTRGVRLFDTGLGGLILINLIFTFAIPGISVGGHIGGLIGGALAGWLLILLPLRSRALPSFLPTAAVLALGVAVIGASMWAASQWMDPVF
ncbi:MAG: rhomboid family intramembrane serine protease [Acidimicrobiales bacterium]